MCVIITMKAGTLIDKDAWENAVYNNEHGFGMIVRIPRKTKNDELKLIKEFNENGLHPDDLWEHVVKYKKYDRHIHLRYKTAGSVSLDNVQPFLIYEDKENDRIAYFMHNGTLNGYKVGNYATVKNLPYGHPTFISTEGRDIENMSDSQNFADLFLTPMVKSFYTPEVGAGDYTNEVFMKLLETEWNATRNGTARNRGIIISNYAPPLRLNPDMWEIFYNNEPNDDSREFDQFVVSNDDYFDDLVRGSLFDQIEEEKKAQKEKEAEERRAAAAGTAETREIVPLLTFRPNASYSTNLPPLTTIFGDPDIFNEDKLNAYYLSGVTYEEWMKLLKEKELNVGAYILRELSHYAYDVTMETYSAQAALGKMKEKYDEMETKWNKAYAQNIALINKLEKAEKQLKQAGLDVKKVEDKEDEHVG